MKSDTVVYIVWAGESVREQTKLSSLMSWAFQNGATLRQWSEDIDYYLTLESERVCHSASILNFGFVRAEMSVAEALLHAQADDWDVYDNNLVTAKSYFHQIQFLDRPAVDPKKSSIIHSGVLTEPRKYLSDGGDGKPFIIRFK